MRGGWPWPALCWSVIYVPARATEYAIYARPVDTYLRNPQMEKQGLLLLLFRHRRTTLVRESAVYVQYLVLRGRKYCANVGNSDAVYLHLQCSFYRPTFTPYHSHSISIVPVGCVAFRRVFLRHFARKSFLFQQQQQQQHWWWKKVEAKKKERTQNRNLIGGKRGKVSSLSFDCV